MIFLCMTFYDFIEKSKLYKSYCHGHICNISNSHGEFMNDNNLSMMFHRLKHFGFYAYV